VRCEEDRTSCYFLNNTFQTYAQAVKACKRIDGAYLVAWNDADEQLRLESYFRVGVRCLLQSSGQLLACRLLAPRCADAVCCMRSFSWSPTLYTHQRHAGHKCNTYPLTCWTATECLLADDTRCDLLLQRCLWCIAALCLS
jgi:hypothetical protein